MFSSLVTRPNLVSVECSSLMAGSLKDEVANLEGVADKTLTPADDYDFISNILESFEGEEYGTESLKRSEATWSYPLTKKAPKSKKSKQAKKPKKNKKNK